MSALTVKGKRYFSPAHIEISSLFINRPEGARSAHTRNQVCAFSIKPMTVARQSFNGPSAFRGMGADFAAHWPATPAYPLVSLA